MAVAGDEHERGAGVERLHHAGEQVGGAGPQRRVAHPHPPAHLGVRVGREHAAALVVHQVVVDAEPARGVVERQELESAHAEHRSDLVRGQHPGQRLAAGHFHRLAHFRLLRELAGMSVRSESLLRFTGCYVTRDRCAGDARSTGSRRRGELRSHGPDTCEIPDEDATMNKARVSLDLPASLKTAAEDFARRDGVSLNQFISTAVARKVGAVEAADFFRKRGAGGDRQRAIDFLRGAPDVPPIPDGERLD